MVQEKIDKAKGRQASRARRNPPKKAKKKMTGKRLIKGKPLSAYSDAGLIDTYHESIIGLAELEALSRDTFDSDRDFHQMLVNGFRLRIPEIKKEVARRGLLSNPRKKAKKKTPTAKELVAKCQKLWKSYCGKPGVTKLRAVAKHCEAMKSSKTKSAADERKRCMQSVRAEAKSRGWKL